jgi:hypothetical protein
VGVDVDAEAVALSRAARGGGGSPPVFFVLGGLEGFERVEKERELSERRSKEKKSSVFFFVWLGERLPLAFRSLSPPPSLSISISESLQEEAHLVSATRATVSLFGGGAIEAGTGAEGVWPIGDFDDLASALVVVALGEGLREEIDALLSPPRANAAAAEVIKWRRRL